MYLVCDPKDVLDISDDISDENINFYGGSMCEIELCWNYFVQNYDCYLLHSEDARLNRNNFSNFYNINFSFKKNEHFQDQIRVFSIKKKKICEFNTRSYNYISDYNGFALLSRSYELLELYYYDIESKFTSYVKIPFSYCECECEMKVVNRTVWLVTKRSYRIYVVDAVGIRDEKEWYHITSMSTSPIDLEHNESSYMLVDFKDNPIDFDCEVLYIDDSLLKINEISEIEFVKLEIPSTLDDNKALTVIGIYKKTVILIDQVNDTEHFYFLTYEGSHLKSCKRMNICETFELAEHGFNKFSVSQFNYVIIPELGKMLISSDTIIFAIDLRTFQVAQALKIPIVEDEWYDWFPYSKNRKELIIMMEYMDKKFILRFSLIHDLSLKELAIDFVLNNFSTDKVSKYYSLPQSLLQEILSKKIH